MLLRKSVVIIRWLLYGLTKGKSISSMMQAFPVP